jgi:hypothetical protein
MSEKGAVHTDVQPKDKNKNKVMCLFKKMEVLANVDR